MMHFKHGGSHFTRYFENSYITFSDLIDAIQQWKRQLKLSIVGVSNRGSRRAEVWSYFGQELVVGDV